VKIIPKLTLSLFVSSSAILAVNGYLRVERERGYFDADRMRDHEMIGRSLAAATTAVWKSEGEQAARQAFDAVSQHFTTIRIGWADIDKAGAGGMAPSMLASTPAGQPTTRVTRVGGVRAWDTLVPLEVLGIRRGFIELIEPTTSEEHFVRGVVVDTAVMAMALAVVSATLAFVMGQWLVGARMRLLSEKARRIGLGDFAAPVVLGQDDELTALGREINAMCDRLATALQQLRHADRLATVGKLASGVAHEMGTPLNVVRERAKMIAEGDTSESESREYARIIVTATEQTIKTIRQLLQFARRSQVVKAQRDLRALVSETLDLLRPLAGKRGIVFKLAGATTNLRANVDGGQLQQVITNLIMNAIQATPGGGVVELSISRESAPLPPDLGGGDVTVFCLRVRDAGCGISPEHLPYVFEPFFTTKDVGEGTGLGLAVAYGIIREHGGWIAVESQLGRGTVFSVFLPATDAATPDDPASPPGR
jgi:signal transduction histidine kinase